ncbi:serine hydrolase domain-containing protein [Myxococcota bacterium]
MARHDHIQDEWSIPLSKKGSESPADLRLSDSSGTAAAGDSEPLPRGSTDRFHRLFNPIDALGHRAGLTHEAPVGNNFNPASPSFNAHAESISKTWLRFPVGARYSYSNLGIDLAGYTLQTISNTPFAQYVKVELFKPLAMTNSSFEFREIETNTNRAIGHSKGAEDVPLAVPMIPSGGLYASVSDMGKYVQLHLNNGKLPDNGRQLIGRDLLDEMYRIPWPMDGQTEGYALGIGKRTRKGKSYFSHGGGGFGFLCDMMWYPDEGLGIVILTNSADHSLQGKLAHEVLDAFLEAKTEKGQMASRKAAPSSCPIAGGEQTRRQADRLLGTYLGRSGMLVVEIREGSVGIVHKEDFYPLSFESNTEACEVRDGEELRYRFSVGREGIPTAFVRLNDGHWWDFNDGSTLQQGPSKKTWQQFEGEYAVDVWGKQVATIRLHLKNGYLYLDEVRLLEHEPGLFFSPDGETVDLRSTPTTFRNVPIRRLEQTPGKADPK